MIGIGPVLYVRGLDFLSRSKTQKSKEKNLRFEELKSKEYNQDTALYVFNTYKKL